MLLNYEYYNYVCGSEMWGCDVEMIVDFSAMANVDRPTDIVGELPVSYLSTRAVPDVWIIDASFE
jgi:hypothetical protein